ncbi:hypothetical protein VP01_4416g1, partial [Puccinia sorghi]
DNDNIFELFNAPPNSAESRELGNEKILSIWWKVCHLDHSKKFPLLFSLAKDYLASAASSCATEQMFSSAANVCSSGCGILKPWKIERCEILRMLTNILRITLISLKKNSKNDFGGM